MSAHGPLPQFWHPGEPDEWDAPTDEPTWDTVPSEALVRGLLDGYRRHCKPEPKPRWEQPPPLAGRRGRWQTRVRIERLGEHEFRERTWVWVEAAALLGVKSGARDRRHTPHARGWRALGASPPDAAKSGEGRREDGKDETP